MIRAILIDDERLSLELVASLIENYCPGVEVIGTYTDPTDGMTAIRSLQPDVVLLDIEMPGITGLELLHRLPIIDFEVIFITAHNQYALNAIKLSALDYLLKPVDPVELTAALSKVNAKQKRKEGGDKFDLMMSLLQQTVTSNRQQHRIGLPTTNGTVYVSMADIVRVEADQQYCQFHLRAGQGMIIVSRNIKVYESLEDYGFMRVHRSHIVNLMQVSEFIRLEGGYLIMSDGHRVDVSKQHRDDLLQRLELQ